MVKEIKLSASRINTLLSCKFKYWLQYVDRVPKMDKDVFIYGNVVHNTLEFAGAIFIKNGNKFLKEDYKKIYNFYNEISIKLGLASLELHEEGKQLVKKRLDDFMDGEAVIGLETKFGFTKENEFVLDNGVKLIGAIDKVEKLNSDTLLIVDYKTSKTAPTTEQMDTDLQLSIYDLVAKKLWPEYKHILLSLDLLKHDKLYTYRTDEQRENFVVYLKEIHKQMNELTKETAKPKLNIFCAWCDYKEYCPEYQKVINENEVIPSYVNFKDEELIDLWLDLKAKCQILINKEKDIAEILKIKLSHSSYSTLNGSSKQIYMHQKKMTYYDVNTISKIIPKNDLKKVVKIQNSLLKNYLLKNAAINNLISDTEKISYTRPYIMSRKLKEK